MITALLIFFSFSLHAARYMALPLSMHSQAVYYIQAHQLDKWSCSYNAMFNACNLEHTLGFQNPSTSIKEFKRRCKIFIDKKKKQSTDGLLDFEVEELSWKFGLQRTQYLYINKYGRVSPALDELTEIIVFPGTPKEKIQKLLDDKAKKREDALIQQLESQLSKKKDGFIHFLCHVEVESEGHCILISLVQKNWNCRALYIFDNTNTPIEETSEAARHIRFLCGKFNISSWQTFNKLKVDIPDAWIQCNSSNANSKKDFKI